MVKGIVTIPFILFGFGRGQKKPWVDVAGEAGGEVGEGGGRGRGGERGRRVSCGWNAAVGKH